jgi:hypothetical protein
MRKLYEPHIKYDLTLFSPIPTKGLLPRLIEEIRRAAKDLASDPSGFVRNALSSDVKDPKRRQLLYGGLALAIAVYGSLLTLIFAVGWRNVFLPRSDQQLVRIHWVDADAPPHLGSPGTGSTGAGEKPGSAHGNGGTGGGSGQQTPTPTSKGPLPPSALNLPLVAPNPPTIPAPTLAVPNNIVGPPAPAPPPTVQTGVPNGVEGPFSPGPGKGGNLGNGNGLGAGDGDRNGGGKGSGAGIGNNRKAGLPSGNGTGYPSEFIWEKDTRKPGFSQFTWIHRPHAITPPEAQANKVYGTVVLRATFNADGTITDIEPAMVVDFMVDAAIESLQHSTFRPFTFNGAPVTVRRVLIKIDVSLVKGKS